MKITLTKEEKELAINHRMRAIKSVFDRIKNKIKGPCLRLAVNAVNKHLGLS